MAGYHNRIVQRNMEFATELDYKNLEQAFHIERSVLNDSIEIRTQISIEPTEDIREFSLVLERKTQSVAEKRKTLMRLFPKEIERMIYSYLSGSNTIRIKVRLPQQFPLHSPTFEWESSTKKTKEIMKAIEHLNCQLKESNSPAHSVKSLLLILVSRILEVIE